MAVTETQSAIYHGFNISLALFDSVSNCKELKQLAMTGKINATLLKPSMVRLFYYASPVETGMALDWPRCHYPKSSSHAEIVYRYQCLLSKQSRISGKGLKKRLR